MFKFNLFAVFIIFILLNVSDDVSCANYTENKSFSPFVFLGIGENDNIEIAKTKNKENGYSCITGKSSSIEINSLNINDQNILPNIQEILNMDVDLLHWGSSDKIEEMPIDVLHCTANSDSIFNYWDYFFSNKTGKLLSILVYANDNNVLYENLYLKHGYCVKDKFCENKDNYLFLIDVSENRIFVVFLFSKNIKDHYEIVKNEHLNKKKNQKKHIKEAF